MDDAHPLRRIGCGGPRRSWSGGQKQPTTPHELGTLVGPASLREGRRLAPLGSHDARPFRLPMTALNEHLRCGAEMRDLRGEVAPALTRGHPVGGAASLERIREHRPAVSRETTSSMEWAPPYRDGQATSPLEGSIHCACALDRSLDAERLLAARDSAPLVRERGAGRGRCGSAGAAGVRRRTGRRPPESDPPGRPFASSGRSRLGFGFPGAGPPSIRPTV